MRASGVALLLAALLAACNSSEPVDDRGLTLDERVELLEDMSETLFARGYLGDGPPQTERATVLLRAQSVNKYCVTYQIAGTLQRVCYDNALAQCYLFARIGDPLPNACR